MLRCKKGDLAIVLKGEYIGHYVTVIKFIGLAYGKGMDGSRWHKDNFWETTFPRGAKAIEGTNGRGGYADDELLPIRPGDLKETEDAEKEVESV